MVSRTTSALTQVTTVSATDFLDLVQSATDVRIDLDDLIEGLLPLTTPATESGAEVNDVVSVGGGIDLHTGSKTGSQVQLKTLIEGLGCTITDGGTTLTVAVDPDQVATHDTHRDWHRLPLRPGGQRCLYPTHQRGGDHRHGAAERDGSLPCGN